MPGPFTHIYAQRQVADFLGTAAAEGGATGEFVRARDGDLLGAQALDPARLDGLTPAECSALMEAWPKFGALGAIGPDLFFFLQDYAQPAVPCDELMLAMSLLYWLDDQGRLDDPWDGLLAIIGDITGNAFVAILRFVIKLDKIWQKFLDVVDDTVGPILDAAGQVIDDLTGGLLSELGDAFTTLKNDLLAFAGEEILSEADIFAWFSLKMRAGYDEQSFLWSDMTHYRLTSKVPGRLLEHARAMRASLDPTEREHGDQLAAYALGWTCHVATDTIAHSFVNEQAGGPFRTHWQRHHLVENHLDAFVYEASGNGSLPADDKVGWIDTYEGLAHSAVFFAVQIPQGIDGLPADKKQGDWRQPLPDADTRVHRKERAKLLDTDGAIPPWMADTLARVLVEVYGRPDEGGLTDPEYVAERGPHPRNLQGGPFQAGLGDGSALLGHWLGVLGIGDPGLAMADLLKAVAPAPPADLPVPEGFPLPWEIQVAYRFLLSWFKRQYDSGLDMDKPHRPTVFVPPASDFVPTPPDFSGVDPSDPPLEQACEVLAALLDWLFKSLEQAARLAYDLAKSAASAGSLPARDALYYGLILPAWQACENIRQVLVHMAYLMPQSELHYADGELRRPNEIDHELISLGHTVDGAFAAALGAAFDVLGNLDHDPALTVDTIRNPKGGPNRAYPWLPVRPTRTSDGQTTSAPGLFGSDVVEFRRPWGFPDRTNDPDPKLAGNTVETPQTVPGPYPQDAMPTVLLGRDGPADNRMRYDYETSGCPEQTDTYNEEFIGRARFTNGYDVPDGTLPADVSGTNPLGDPVVFSAYLIGQIAGNPRFAADFNLDADRGFGYLAWDWVRDPERTEDNQRGQAFRVPLTWPEGAVGHWRYPPSAPAGQDPPPLDDPALRLRYLGRECGPGASDPAGGHAPAGPAARAAGRETRKRGGSR